MNINIFHRACNIMTNVFGYKGTTRFSSYNIDISMAYYFFFLHCLKGKNNKKKLLKHQS